MAFLASLLPQFGFRTEVFFYGEFCSQNTFSGDEPVGHLHLVKKGSVTMVHENAPNLEVNVPSLVIYPRPFKHRLVAASTPVELICATITFRNARRNPLAKLLPSFIALPLDELKSLAPTVQLLIEEAGSEQDGRQEVMDKLCDILMIQLFRHIQRMGALPDNMLSRMADSRIAAVINALHETPAKPWTIAEMAGIASMSRSSFAKHFHEAVGVPPASYLTDMRLTLATSYLRQNHSVKQTAQAVGYSSQPAFTKAFSAKFGMAPLKWVAQQT
jgi:AraC-like DNA-binding protein